MAFGFGVSPGRRNKPASKKNFLKKAPTRSRSTATPAPRRGGTGVVGRRLEDLKEMERITKDRQRRRGR